VEPVMRNFATHFWTKFQEVREDQAFAFVGEGGVEQESYREWTLRVQRLAMGLMQAGLEPGTRIGMIAPNSRAWLDVAFAGWLIGACVVPLVPDRDRRETLRCLARSGCDWIVLRDQPARLALRGQANLPDHLRWIVLEGDDAGPGIQTYRELESQGRDRLRRGGLNELAKRTYELAADLPVLMLFEPEPGDDPHGAHYSGAKLAVMLEQLGRSLSFKDEARVAVIMNYGWFSAALFSFAALLAGKTLLTASSLSELRANLKPLRPTHLVCGPAFLEGQASRWLERLEKAPEFVRRLTETEATPSGSQTLNRALGLIGERAAQKLFYEPMLEDFGGRLEAIHVFEGRVPEEVLDILEHTRVEVLSHWGVPECGVSHVEHRGARRRGSVGRPIEGYAARIADARAEGVGEILVRSDVLFDGYWDEQGPRTVEQGWLHTGTTGRMESGYLFVCTS
jgi:long-chain acyl-CoA synthetase